MTGTDKNDVLHEIMYGNYYEYFFKSAYNYFL